jgi:hypothetical protein
VRDVRASLVAACRQDRAKTEFLETEQRRGRGKGRMGGRRS